MSKQKIQLSDHFDYSRLIRFVLPCIGTMLFTSIYGIVDGLCVSNFVGKTAFAAVNLIMPVPMLVGTVGFMLGTGGSAIVGITLGEGDKARADRYFSLFMSTALIAGIVLSVLGMLLLRPVALMLGAEGEMLDYALRYGRVLMLSLPTFILQNMFQSFFVTAEKPHLGFYFTVGAGCTNMVLDVLLVGILHWSVEGAAIATMLSQVVGGLLPVFYFLNRKNTSLLHLCRPQFEGGVLLKACVNGSSELMTNLSMSLVNILYNYQLLRLAGENGVAAYGVIMYACFLFIAVYVGYAFGSAPIVSFHYGAGNRAEVHNLYEKSLRLIAVVAFTLDRGSTYTFKGTARQYYAGNAAAIESGTKLKRSQKGETLLVKGGHSIQTDLPIYPTDRRRVVLPTDMVFVAPRSDKFYRMSYFTEVECQPGGTVIARRGNDRATVEQGFLFDGKDTYLFLEPMTVSVNGRTLQLPALSYVEAVYGGYVMVFNYETKECFVELSDGSGTAQPPSGDYEISLLGDSMTMHDGSRSLLATEPSLFDPVV